MDLLKELLLKIVCSIRSPFSWVLKHLINPDRSRKE